MTSQADRRRFLKVAGTGIAASVVGASALNGGDDTPQMPVPDTDTKASARGTKTAACDASCACDPASTLIFACSGAADTGALADQAARKLMKDGMGKMYCLAGVGGRIDPLMKGTATAKTILALDGCPLGCTRHTLEKAGFKVTRHICVTDLGLTKGQSPVTDGNVAKVAEAGKKALGANSD